MSLSTAAIEKNHAILSELITTWLKENPPLDSVSEVINKPENKSEEPKQVVTVALRTRPFLENEASGEEKKLLPGVHARDRKMFVHVPSSKVFAPGATLNRFLTYHSGTVQRSSTSLLTVTLPLGQRTIANMYTNPW
jgi:hypothetical protein